MQQKVLQNWLPLSILYHARILRKVGCHAEDDVNKITPVFAEVVEVATLGNTMLQLSDAATYWAFAEDNEVTYLEKEHRE